MSQPGSSASRTAIPTTRCCGRRCTGPSREQQRSAAQMIRSGSSVCSRRRSRSSSQPIQLGFLVDRGSQLVRHAQPFAPAMRSTRPAWGTASASTSSLMRPSDSLMASAASAVVPASPVGRAWAGSQHDVGWDGAAWGKKGDRHQLCAKHPVGPNSEVRASHAFFLNDVVDRNSDRTIEI